MRHLSRLLCLLTICFFPFASLANAKMVNTTLLAKDRKALYLKTSALTGIPWTILAGCDQYERDIEHSKSGSLLGIKMDKKTWAGPLNPNKNDDNPFTIALFNGSGEDGDGDGKARLSDQEDRLFTFADRLTKSGPGWQNNQIALWNYYHRGKAVEMIAEFSRLFAHFNTTHLEGHAFPVPFNRRFDYKSTWGASRGWGGRRIHEGTDIFADYGTPVRATSYGVIELIGWNKYGGWRIGIRDPEGFYHYYGHLRGYAPHVHQGTITKPGQVIGFVGSSGYGPKGTQGKFPPHLHYGIYRDNGKTEFSFDPYPLLRLWENKERSRQR